ncbi:ABC transporter permease [Rhodanobacter hydrolyticus]|uniref:ABC transporter permease subunit n=1 Tax=Rhodanobacter hydrolyticus TaxID=2250595 RepID=A0ABW8J8F1_9GAMM
MSSMFEVFRLELRRLFVRPLAWVLAALTLTELAWRFILLLGNFLGNQIKLAALPDGPGYTDLVGVPLLSSTLTISILPFGLTELALLIVPLLTMSSLAGDRANGTLPLLYASGLAPSKIVLGKYFAMLIWLLLWLALVLAMPLSLIHGTHLDWGKFAAAALGLLLTLATLGAIGIACSAFTSLPAIAATATLMLGLALFTVNLGAQMAGLNSGIINWLAMSTHEQNLLRGLVSTTDIVWFVLLIAVCLALATRRLAADRERG